jgi:hypothetical protein
VRRAVLILAATLAIPVAAEADSVTFDFTASVVTASGIYAAIASGTPVTGTYTITISNGVPAQSVLPVSLTSNWSRVNDSGTGYVFRTHATVGGFTYDTASIPSATSSQSAVLGTAFVPASGIQNDATSGDYVAFESNDFTSVGGGMPQSELQLVSSTGDPFDLSGLPLFSVATSGVGFFTSTDVTTSVLGYQITSLTPVPLPASAWLLLCGLAFLALRRRAA